MPTSTHPGPSAHIAHILPNPDSRIGGGRIEVYRHGTFVGCLYYRQDGTVRSVDAKLRPVAEWVAGLVPRASGSDPN